MNNLVNIFCRGEEQKRLSEKYRVIEPYEGFILAEVSQAELDELSKKYPLEDITSLYTIHTGEQEIDTSIPLLKATGKVYPHPAYKGIKPLSPGRHHYLVQFIGPVKKEWLDKIQKAGGEPRAPYADFTYVVRVDDKILKRIAELSFVRWIGHLPHMARVTPSVLKRASRKAGDVYSDLPRTHVIPGIYIIEFFGSEDVAKASSQVKKQVPVYLKPILQGK